MSKKITAGKNDFMEQYGLLDDVDTSDLQRLEKYHEAVSTDKMCTDMLITPQDIIMKTDIAHIDKRSSQVLANRFGILFSEPWVATTVATVVMQQAIKQLTAKMAASGKKSASINFNDIIELHVSTKENEDAEKEGNIIITFTPGMEAKLLIKSDEMTETE